MTTSKNTLELLQRLADDDDFRSRLEANPVATLAEYGFQVDPAIAPFAAHLPSKEHIRDNMDLLSKQMEASNTWVIFMR
ncbi:NHLP-related RiPP peptide [Lysobacter sp.]|uniref:NHLP-related RiPP peptide n=1 Tax=Lysobacter sp. TaxID=72226 RepID=UPI002D6EA151|nr:NHLP-related RiPP peptide [Lysobacter sp.]HZX78939.1 NHLP-related RiPP peptide [Lysobacter sp.]